MNDRGKTIAALARGGVPNDTIDAVLRDTTYLHRVAERGCNIRLTDDDERRRDSAESRISKRLAALGIETMFQRDPRGAVVLARRRTWWGGEDWYVVG
jgi:hypothetical protein